jgi:hypothetical protein
MWKPSPRPRPESEPDGAHAATPERPAGFRWLAGAALKGQEVAGFFVPFSWLLHRSDNVVLRRQEQLHRATAYGVVPVELRESVIVTPIE